jgi:hypothetical protein
MGITTLYFDLTTSRQAREGLANMGRFILDNLY